MVVVEEEVVAVVAVVAEAKVGEEATVGEEAKVGEEGRHAVWRSASAMEWEHLASMAALISKWCCRAR